MAHDRNTTASRCGTLYYTGNQGRRRLGKLDTRAIRMGHVNRRALARESSAGVFVGMQRLSVGARACG
jgi:hypothetical protein